MTSVLEAASALVASDSRFEEIRVRFGDPRLAREATRSGSGEQVPIERSVFQTLVRTVVSQQLSGVIADRLYERIELLCSGEVTPAVVVDVGSDGLAGLGLSRAKAQSIHELAQKLMNGEVSFYELEAKSDEEVMRLLVQLRGFGPWSAHMFLIFHLGRLDVWPSGDLGIRKGLSRLLESDELLGVQATELYGERWRPYRTIAAWYLWRLADEG